MEPERFLLKWNNHQSNLVTVFDQLYEQEAFTDVTLACDGKSFAAHKVILSACSPYFQSLFLANPNTHPIVFMRDVRGPDLESLLAFMYRGEINVHQQDLASFLKTAESLQIKGLSDSSERQRDTSKILEAMEKKFNTHHNNNNNTIQSNNNNSIPSSNSISHPSALTSSSTSLHTANNTSPVAGLTSPASAYGIGNLPRVSSALCNSLTSLRLGHSLNGGLSSPYSNLSAAALSAAAAAAAGNGYPENLSTSNSNNSDRRSPPMKRQRSLEDLPRILPKVRGALNSPPSLITNIPGLLTPITLAAAAVNSVVTQPQMPILANTPTSVHASPPTPETSSSSDAATPPKDRIKREILTADINHHHDNHQTSTTTSTASLTPSATTTTTVVNGTDHLDKNGHAESCYLNASDSPHHAMYLGSSVGSGSSTPSLDVKEEDGDHLDDTACHSDESHNISEEHNMDTSALQGMYADDVLTPNRERLSYPCRFCGKRFTQTGTCRRHERLHTAPNGFKCPFCQKGFNRKYRLREHLLSAHPTSAEESDISLIVNTAASGIV